MPERPAPTITTSRYSSAIARPVFVWSQTNILIASGARKGRFGSGDLLVAIGQLLEQPIALGDVLRLAAFQPPQAEPGGAGVAAILAQGGDQLALAGNVLFLAIEQDLGIAKKLFQGGSIHDARGAAMIGINARVPPVWQEDHAPAVSVA